MQQTYNKYIAYIDRYVMICYDLKLQLSQLLLICSLFCLVTESFKSKFDRRMQ